MPSTPRSLAGIIAAVSMLFMAFSAQAQITIDRPWVRATVAQQNATGAFMRLSSKEDSTLVQAESPVAQHVEIHEMVMVDEIMKMRQIPRLALPAGQIVELRPGSHHIMLIGLKEQLRAGSHVPLTLTFEHPDGKRETLEITAPVRPLASGAPGNDRQPAH
ncbi:copper chaperone PCu(A)C [Castellaniella sp.]|uniref:copper chaperone PCu(A)C n=1 Tax=Castellaniella sp. TaxID=1955812 RepID=UPI002AFFF546|nr:copper chaperone PCu(A)C [Castellaniella sp.]